MHEHSGTVVMDPGSYYEWMFPGISLKRKNVLVKCLLHNDRTPSLSIDTETGRFYCHGCGQSGGDVIDFHQRLNPGMTYREAVAEISGGTRSIKVREFNSVSKSPTLDRQKKLQCELQETEDVTVHNLAGTYLQFRRILPECFPSNIRFHPELDYWVQEDDGKWISLGKFPAMVAKIEDLSGNLVGLHRTYLTRDGRKADVPSPKKVIAAYDGATRGSAIRLFEATERLAIGEGIETSTAYTQLTRVPSWAAVNAGGLERVIVPNTVKEVWICIDVDRSGRGNIAADKLAQRLLKEGRRVYKAAPPGGIPSGAKSFDWSDYLETYQQNEYTTNPARF